MKRWQLRIKRMIDVVVALPVTLIVLPLLYVVLAAPIKLSSKGPVFFRQLRTGLRGREFMCYKFRSMCVNDEADTVAAANDDVRITKIGKLLRFTYLDEFPQFYNVLRGDMSLMGPRPHMVFHTKKYEEIIPDYDYRLKMKPGLTGASQAIGLRGTAGTDVDMMRRVRVDCWYVRNWSLCLDIKIFLMTVRVFAASLYQTICSRIRNTWPQMPEK